MCEFCDSLSGYKKEKVEKGMRHEYRVKIATKRIRGERQVSTETCGVTYELNYCPECGKKLSQLRACPFCGREVAKVMTARELFRDEGIEGIGGFYAICGVNEGGCGTSSGWHKTEEEAMEAWNRRGGK